jgi:16S rRNA processing protein RimM
VNNPADWLIVGCFGRAHGVKGFITVHSFTEPRDNILKYSRWHVLLDNQWTYLDYRQTSITEKHILVLVAGFDTRETLNKLINAKIGIRKGQLPILGSSEFYWHQLIGMQVVNQKLICLGHVTEMLETGSNDVLIVTGIKQVLIPYLVGRSIISVDLDKQLIVVDWDMDF